LLGAAVFLGALYAFRGLYGAIPFLLAIGLAVVGAVAALVLVRLVKERDLAFQGRRLRIGSRVTPRGWIVAVLAAAFLLFGAQSGVVQYHVGEASRLVAEGRELDAQARLPNAAAALDHLSSARRVALFSDERTFDLESGAHRLRGDHAAAAAALERSLERNESV